jgi:hypothetical protein
VNLNQAVIDIAYAVAALNALPALLGAWRWHQGESSRAFWVLLRVGQAGALVLALTAGGIVAAGHGASDKLFYLYAVLPVVIGFVAEQLRITSAQTILDQRNLPDAQAVGTLPEAEQRLIVALIVRREMGVMTLSSLVVVILAARAAMTAVGI